MQSVQEQTVNTPDIESSGVSQVTDSPEIEMPEIEMPEIKVPEIKVPEIEVPEIKVVVVPNIEEVSIPVSSVPIPICQSSTDRKPICVFGFAGGYNNCLGFLHHSVKPIVGVVKYDFSKEK